jgi:hypothetical protein
LSRGLASAGESLHNTRTAMAYKWIHDTPRHINYNINK